MFFLYFTEYVCEEEGLAIVILQMLRWDATNKRLGITDIKADLSILDNKNTLLQFRKQLISSSLDPVISSRE